MADQSDKQKAKHLKGNHKKRVVTRSRSRNFPRGIESSDSDTSSSDCVNLDNSCAVIKSFPVHGYFLGEGKPKDNPSGSVPSEGLKRKHPENLEKVSVAKKTKDNTAKEKESHRHNKSRSSKGKSKMSSSSSTSLNESLENSACEATADFNIVSEKPTGFSPVLDTSFDSVNNEEDSDIRDSVSVDSNDLLQLSNSAFIIDEKETHDKSLNNTSCSSSSPSCSLTRSESDASAEFPFPLNSDEHEIREILRNELKNIEEHLQTKSKRLSVIQHRKKVMNSDKKTICDDGYLERNIVKTSNLNSDDKSVPSGSRSHIHVMMDEPKIDLDNYDSDMKIPGSSSQNDDMQIEPSDSKVQVKLSSMSKRTRHHASLTKNDVTLKMPSRSSDDFIPGSLAAALDAADAAVASFASSSQSDNSASGSSASNSDSANKDSELGRLQALLEARGIPLHVFGALGHRMQHLIHRSMGGSSSNSRVQQLLQGLQAVGDEGRQLQAVVEMCQLLVMGNEDTLIGFPVKQVVPVLINLLSMEHNFEMMNNACRALTYLMEALPRSSSVVVDAVPVFLNKIQVIQCMDVAEQSLTALEMLSKWHNKAILHAKGVSICLTYLDFFSINSQRSALSIIANCFQNLLPNEFPLVQDSLPILSSWLSRQDEKSVESICLAFSRLVDCFQYDTKYLKEIASQNLLSNILELLLLSPSILSTQTFTTIMRMLALICASCPELAILLLNLNIAETLCYLLIGNSDNYNIKLTPRNHQELLEISFLICELMPCLPTDGIFSIDSVVMKHKNRKKDFVVWKWRDDSGIWQSYSVSDSKLIETAYQSGVDTFRHTEETSTGESLTTILDLNALQQISGDSNTKRPLKRCLSSFSDAMFQSSSGSSSDKPNVKVDHFKENSDMVNNCIKALFPVLYEIYSSSAGPSIRYNCLRAMLRMIYFAPPDVLELVLKSQLLSRNIAAMLASSDIKVLTSTLQMAQLLIQKLPEVFGVHFIREGVMHEIRTLAKIDVSSRLTDAPLESISSFGSNILRSSTSSVLSSSKSFQFITSIPCSQETPSHSSSSASSSSSKCLRKETSSDGSVSVKIIDLNKRHSSKDKECSSRKESPVGQSSASCSLTSEKYEKVNSWIREMAKKFEEFFGIEEFESSHPAVNVLNQLTSAVSHLETNSDNGFEALSQICHVMTERDISSFELIHSGLIEKLYAFLTVSLKSSQDEFSVFEEHLRTFSHVFIGASPARAPFDLTVLNPSPLVNLIDKLNACISHLEQFPVKVHDVSSRSLSRRGTNALRFFNTHHLKCMFQRHPECNNLRQWRGGPVMIDPLASIHNIDQYLVGQGLGAVKSEDDDDEDDDDEDDDEDDDSDQSDDNSDENMIDIAAALRMNPNQESQKLQFLIGNNVLPYNMTIYQAVRQYSNIEGQSSDSHDVESEDPLGISNIWTKTHTIFYRPLPPDSLESNSSSEVVLTRSKAEKRKKQLSDRTHGKGSRKEDHKSEKAKGDSLWNEGIVPEINPLLCFVSNIHECKSSTLEDPSLEVIYLLKVIHTLNSQWGLLYHLNSWEPAVSQTLFINQKLTLKANRQLQDLISVMTGNVPAWLSNIAQEFPFLFPFQTRYLIFYVTSFDKDRALQRVIDVMPEVKNNDRIAPKFDKRKRTISREGILKQAESVLQDIGNSKAVLEIQYKNEVGTGLGPTLEFYAIVSKELQRYDLEMWRGEKTVAQNGKGILTSYVHNSVGLFPLPLSRNAKQSLTTKVCNKFKLLGNFLAKSVMDSRLLDIPLSLTFYKWMLNQDNNFSLADIKHIDESLAQTVFKLEELVAKKNQLEYDSPLDSGALKSALESLKLDGCSVEDLNLDFTLPGFPHIELRKGGRDMTVNIHNLEEYLKLLKHWMMKEGVARQMKAFRDGFESVFPIKHLQIFYPEELELLFCGSEHTKWDVRSLMECCRSDHGYTHESRAIKFLFDILCSYDQQQQRQFLQFITGSPRLPVGGLKSLSPPLTIVKKTSDDSKDSDHYLPSVMTCVNYLKLPDYSTIEIMREKLDIAVNEGQHSFHLS